MKKSRSLSSKCVLFASDLHAGSATALSLPVIHKQDTENEIKANRIQHKLYESWQSCIDRITKKPTVLGLNGDLIDGANPKQRGNQSTLTNVKDQCDMAVELLRMIKAENIVMTRGSGYHVQVGDLSMEEYIAKELGVRRYRAYSGEETLTEKEGDKTAALTDYFALFKVQGKLFNMTHHIGYSKLELYRTTTMAREMMALKLAVDKYHKADIISRGHVHYYVQVGFSHTKGFTTPAWKMPDGHLFRQGMAGTAPDIGMVEVVIEPNGETIVRPLIEDVEIKPRVLEF